MYRLGVAGIIEKKVSIWLGVDLRMCCTFSIQRFNDDPIGFGMDCFSSTKEWLVGAIRGLYTDSLLVYSRYDGV